jgi:hypothetical protein
MVRYLNKVRRNLDEVPRNAEVSMLWAISRWRSFAKPLVVGLIDFSRLGCRGTGRPKMLVVAGASFKQALHGHCSDFVIWTASAEQVAAALESILSWIMLSCNKKAVSTLNSCISISEGSTLDIEVLRKTSPLQWHASLSSDRRVVRSHYFSKKALTFDLTIIAPRLPWRKHIATPEALPKDLLSS